MAVVEQRLKSTLGAINLHDGQALRTALNRQGIAVTQTNHAALAPFRANQVVADLIRYRELEHRITQFARPILNALDADDRVRCTFDFLGTANADLTTRAPNIQGVPKDKQCRSCFTPATGHLFVIADYKAIDLRIIADWLREEELLRAFKEGVDPHTRTAARLLNKPVADVTEDERRRAKAAGYGLSFGMGSRAFIDYARDAYDIELSPADEKLLRESYFAAYPKIRQWHADPAKTLEIRSASHRLRKLQPTESGEVPFAEWLAAPVQGTRADGLKRAIALLYPPLKALGARIIHINHDELVVETPKAKAEECLRLVQTQMVAGMSAFLKDVPVEVEIAIADKWWFGER
jgi:DNA polymerase-1